MTETELMQLVEKNMEDCCKLRGGVYFVTKTFPRLPNGKVDRMRLKYDAGLPTNMKIRRIVNELMEPVMLMKNKIEKRVNQIQEATNLK